MFQANNEHSSDAFNSAFYCFNIAPTHLNEICLFSAPLSPFTFFIYSSELPCINSMWILKFLIKHYYHRNCIKRIVPPPPFSSSWVRGVYHLLCPLFTTEYVDGNLNFQLKKNVCSSYFNIFFLFCNWPWETPCTLDNQN